MFFITKITIDEEAEKRGIGVIKVVGNKVEYYTDRIKIY